MVPAVLSLNPRNESGTSDKSKPALVLLWRRRFSQLCSGWVNIGDGHPGIGGCCTSWSKFFLTWPYLQPVGMEVATEGRRLVFLGL